MINSPTLTDAAAARIAVIAEKQAKPAILRLSVEGGGCSGFQYKFGLADAAESDDAIRERDGVKLLVDPVSLDLVAGSTVDFVESLGGAAFRVENPQAAAGCGCGSSFGIEPPFGGRMSPSYRSERTGLGAGQPPAKAIRTPACVLPASTSTESRRACRA